MSTQESIEHPRNIDTRFRLKPYGWFLLFLLIWLPLAAVVTVNNFLWLMFSMIIGAGRGVSRISQEEPGFRGILQAFSRRNLRGNPFLRPLRGKVQSQTLGFIWLHPAGARGAGRCR